MDEPDLETDYLVIGAGAAGLAFADALVAASDAHVTIVDRRGMPGGHWNDAYAFVTLHQPSSYYGVSSLELGSGLLDADGPNAGLGELATGAEVCGYYARVMHRMLLPTGRVRFLPLHDHLGGGELVSRLDGRRRRLLVRRRIVDATAFSPAVPATHVPRFEVGPGVRVIPPGGLVDLWKLGADAPPPSRFVLIGAGKTAMDTALWLMRGGVEPDAIEWVMPRDAWLINRETTQNARSFFERAIGAQVAEMEALAQAGSADDLFERLEAAGNLLRIDPGRRPTMFHYANMSPGEVAALRRLKRVLRMGRVRAIDATRMVLDGGEVPVLPGTLFVDCSASAIRPWTPQPIFGRERIVVQIVRMPQIAFSAALIGHVEALHGDDEATKNRLCTAVPFPYTIDQYPRTMLVNLMNQLQWSQDKALREWIRANRLDAFGRLVAGVDRDDTERQALLARLKAGIGAAMANLPALAARAAG